MVASLHRGDRIPDFVAPTDKGLPTRFYAVAGGRPTLMLFATADQAADVHRLLDQLAPDVLAATDVILIRSGPVASGTGFERVFVDEGARIRSSFKLPAESCQALALSPNLRLLAPPSASPLEAAYELSDLLRDALQQEEATVIGSHAPVLLIPDVLDSRRCQELVQLWQAGGHEATGIEASLDGARSEFLDDHAKRRQDHIVGDRAITNRLTTTLGRRVLPEVARAFSYRADRFEGFKIACYDGEQDGFFRPHRDNLSPSTAHRRFALTLNLNDDYDGGCLRFPEFAPLLYRPAPGEALLFSCAHLHEVTPVERGRRFTLLSFLFSASEGKARQNR